MKESQKKREKKITRDRYRDKRENGFGIVMKKEETETDRNNRHPVVKMVHIYIYRGRERELEREGGNGSARDCVWLVGRAPGLGVQGLEYHSFRPVGGGGGTVGDTRGGGPEENILRARLVPSWGETDTRTRTRTHKRSDRYIEHRHTQTSDE